MRPKPSSIMMSKVLSVSNDTPSESSNQGCLRERRYSLIVRRMNVYCCLFVFFVGGKEDNVENMRELMLPTKLFFRYEEVKSSKLSLNYPCQCKYLYAGLIKRSVDPALARISHNLVACESTILSLPHQTRQSEITQILSDILQKSHHRCRAIVANPFRTFFSPPLPFNPAKWACRESVQPPRFSSNADQINRLFITPVEPEVAAKSAEKAASGPRSSIRRQRTIRGSHSRPSLAEMRRRRMLGMLADAEPEEHEPAERPRVYPWDRNTTHEHEGRTMGMLDQSERMRLRDTLSFERQHVPSNETDGPFMPPVPESRDYSGTEERQREILRLRAMRQDLRRIARRRPAPTPPYTDADLSVNMILNTRPRVDSPGPSSLTPARSPSHQSSPGEANISPRRPLEESDFSFTARGPPYASVDVSISIDTGQGLPSSYSLILHSSGCIMQCLLTFFKRPARSTISERVHAFNRVSSHMERSRRALRQARLDGLGDRDRSLSPENGAAWDTLLTSITPDPQPPSAGSSFASASAAAAASSSSGSGPASASTSMTSVDRGGDSPTLRDCDILESGSNTEEEEEEDIYELQDINRIRGDRFWRTYADVVTSRDRAARNGGSDTDHLDSMHRIISRLASRDEIPDEWWAEAGLSRNLRREPTT
jgi:hypothetical protein